MSKLQDVGQQDRQPLQTIFFCISNVNPLSYGFTMLAECLTSIRLLICTPISENQGLIQTLEKCQIWCKP